LEDVEAHIDLDCFYSVRDNLPDNKLVLTLEERRDNGRDDFPVQAMWNGVSAGVVFQHESIESLIRELSGNSTLLEGCGTNVLPRHKKPVAELKRIEGTARMEILRSGVNVHEGVFGEVHPH